MLGRGPQAARAHQHHDDHGQCDQQLAQDGGVQAPAVGPEALANLIHPFWMLPLVGILGLKARDIVGYSMLQFVVHVPLVLFLVWILNYTLTYVPPALP